MLREGGIYSGGEINISKSFLHILREQKMLFHTSLILLMNKIFWNTSTCNTEKKIQSYEFAKNQGTNFDKLQGFQVPLISPNALLTDLYIVQSATKYFINFIIYIYLYSNFLLFQFEAYDGGI